MSVCGRRAFLRSEWKEVVLSSLYNHSIGGLWGDAPGVNEVDVDVVRSINFRNDGRLVVDGAARRSIKASALPSRELRRGDILLEKSGGGPKQPVGRVVFVERDLPRVVCGNFIQLIRPGDAVEARWLFYLLWWTHKKGETLLYQSQTTGIRNLRTKDYLAKTVLVPSIEEQRRIVEILNAFDGSFAADQARLSALAVARRELLRSAIREAGASATRPLSSLADVQSGISWKKDAEMHVRTHGAIGVMGVTNVQRDYVHVENCGWIVRTSQAEKRSIKPHTILMIRTNGNADRIGNVHLAPSEAVGYTISSFLTSITPNNPDDAPYILAALQSPQVQQAITDATSGSTGLKNIAVSWVRSMEIPWPSASERQRLTSAVQRVDLALSAYRELAKRSSALRSALVSSLLSGEHSISESYDRLLQGSDPNRVLSEATPAPV